ncbi:hypothetical protein D3C87_1559700 [compost metagenome]
MVPDMIMPAVLFFAVMATWPSLAISARMLLNSVLVLRTASFSFSVLASNVANSALLNSALTGVGSPSITVSMRWVMTETLPRASSL